MQNSEFQNDGVREDWSWLGVYLSPEYPTWTVDEAMALLAGLKPGSEVEKNSPEPRLGSTAAEMNAYFAYKADIQRESKIPRNILLAQRRVDFKKIKAVWERTPQFDGIKKIKPVAVIAWAKAQKIQISWEEDAIKRGFFKNNLIKEEKTRKASPSRRIMVRWLLKNAGLEISSNNKLPRGAISRFQIHLAQLPENIEIDEKTLLAFCDEHGLPLESIKRD